MEEVKEMKRVRKKQIKAYIITQSNESVFIEHMLILVIRGENTAAIIKEWAA